MESSDDGEDFEELGYQRGVENVSAGLETVRNIFMFKNIDQIFDVFVFPDYHCDISGRNTLFDFPSEKEKQMIDYISPIIDKKVQENIEKYRRYKVV